LDLEAIFWLTDYLANYEHTLIVVSHDRTLLNSVCTDIIHLNKQSLKYYIGNYDSFEKARADRLANIISMQNALDDKRAHIEKSIENMKKQVKRSVNKLDINFWFK
jgi:ATP-binding cassette subfamily F protein 3